MICENTSNSTSSKAFDLKLKSDTVAPIQRITDLHDYSTGSYLIVEQDDLFYLAEVKAVDQNNDISVSFFFIHHYQENYSPSQFHCHFKYQPPIFLLKFVIHQEKRKLIQCHFLTSFFYRSKISLMNFSRISKYQFTRSMMRKQSRRKFVYFFKTLTLNK